MHEQMNVRIIDSELIFNLQLISKTWNWWQLTSSRKYDLLHDICVTKEFSSFAILQVKRVILW